MDFKKSIEDNPFTYLITCIITAVTITAGVMEYFSLQETNLLKAKNQAVVEDLNSKLASLRRGIPGNELFDIRNLLYSRSSMTNTPSASSTFFDDFYAAKPDADWTYQETTELAVVVDLAGLNATDAPRGMQQAGTQIKLHLWRARKTLPVEGHEAYKKIYPLVSVEKVTMPQLRAILGSLAADDEKTKPNRATAEQEIKKAVADKHSNAEDVVTSLERVYQNDLIGTFFTSQLMIQFDAMRSSPKTSISLVELQKVGNVLYGQFLVTLKDVKVAGIPYASYYMRKEMIVVSTSDSIFVVGTLVPSADPAPRDPAFVVLSKWLNSFRVVVS